MDALPLFIQALLNKDAYTHPVSETRWLQTHISWIIKTGSFVYKIKKPVNFGFLDFSTLAKRKYFCEQEFRLNQRLASPLYVGVCPIWGPENQAKIGAPQPPGTPVNAKPEHTIIDYAIQMRQFDENNLFSHLLEKGDLQPAHFIELARKTANFHEKSDRDIPGNLGQPETVFEPIQQNFNQIRPFLKGEHDLKQLDQVQQWTFAFQQKHRALFAARREQGFIRACHGDFHLDNIVLFDHQIIPFDCIEFNEGFRWIDTMNDIAFLIMDLQRRNRPDLSYAFLNEYLSWTGDHGGLVLLPFYICYRAMVRAKISLFSLSTEKNKAETGQNALWRAYRRHILLALSCLHSPPAICLLMHGISGSGKTTLAQKLSPHLSAIHIQADVERKRLAGLKPHERGDPHTLYTAEQHEKTYARLLELAQLILNAGYSVVIDATCLKKASREFFLSKIKNLISDRPIVALILSCVAPKTVLQERVTNRMMLGHDASDATVSVVEAQWAEQEPLTAEEQTIALQTDLQKEPDIIELKHQILSLQRKLRCPRPNDGS